jgi:hypothetical protein
MERRDTWSRDLPTAYPGRTSTESAAATLRAEHSADEGSRGQGRIRRPEYSLQDAIHELKGLRQEANSKLEAVKKDDAKRKKKRGIRGTLKLQYGSKMDERERLVREATIRGLEKLKDRSDSIITSFGVRSNDADIWKELDKLVEAHINEDDGFRVMKEFERYEALRDVICKYQCRGLPMITIPGLGTATYMEWISRE